MNIQDARQEIINTVKAYLGRDETGTLLIPTEKQRPILLMGPPGIGKTAIVEQAAAMLNINLVSYTITHHTRQSAIGLPIIVKKNYGGKEYSATEYTMSEIIAEVYDRIEATGNNKGILFLDEINCVSETLTPTMLQFLQYKTFGTHRLPEGFVVVTAGNPPEVNASVRDFDIVTLDRLKKIDIEFDFNTFRSYALNRTVHGCVIAYLELRKEHFYAIHANASGKSFVTARGWEDLSRMLLAYERLNIPISENLAVQYLQDEEVAKGFTSYYRLWNKYKSVYRVAEVLKGSLPDEKDMDEIRRAPFDEKLSIVMLLGEGVIKSCLDYEREKKVQEALRDILSGAKNEADISAYLQDQITAIEEAEAKQKAFRIPDEEADKIRALTLNALDELLLSSDGADSFDNVREWFSLREDERQENISKTRDGMTNAFSFLTKAFGEGQEAVLFLTELNGSDAARLFIGDCGNDLYYKYNKLLLLDDRRKELLNELMELGE